MILGLACTETVLEKVTALNFRKNLDMRTLDCTSLEKIIQQIETGQCFTHVLFDADAIPGTGDELIHLLLRLRQSTTVEYMVLLEGYPTDSRVVTELIDLGIEQKNILFSSTLPLRMRITEIVLSAPPVISVLQQPSELQPSSEEVPIQESLPEPSEPEENLREQENGAQKAEVLAQEEQTNPPLSLSPATLPPPSQITTAQAHAALQEKMLAIQKENCKTALRIAVAGAGNRIGTTTQALQILLHLKLQNKAVALIEMHNHPCLAAYADVYSDAELHKDFCTVNGNRLYFSPDCLPTIQKEYEYLILDFGNFQECSHELFLQSDIKIICCGIKPWETEAINYTFRENDGNFQYLFSFVPPADETDITKQMEEFSQHTFFAPYSPDMFQYNGCDDMYCKLLQHSDMMSDL